MVFAQVPSIEKFHSFASKPYLTPALSLSNSININWNTTEPESTILIYGLSPALQETIRLEGVRTYHHIMLYNLLPNTEYYYKIFSTNEVYKFQTAPEFTDSITFVVFGDTRSDSASHQKVIDRIGKYDFDFIIHTGDFVVKGDDTEAWRTFFNIENRLLSRKILIPTIGNHEKPYWPYDTIFALPGCEYYYSLNYGNTHIVSLNTEMELNGPQKNWLINDLIEARLNPSIDWIFVSLHRPPYSSGSHGSAMEVRNTWSPIFSEYGVDIVFCGHDHSYERTKRIAGVIYIICAGGGAPLYDVGRNEWTEYSEKTHHFCLIKIRGRHLVLLAIKPDGTVFDSLTIRK